MSRAFLIFNVVGFQAVWFASVLGAANGLPWAGPAMLLVYAALHLRFSADRVGDLRMLGIAILLGFAADSLLAASGLLVYASPWPSEALAPAWILAMWAGFALTLHHSMGFLRGRAWMAFAFGAVGGPLAYFGASRGFDAVSFPVDLAIAMLALALVWGASMPALYALHGALWPQRDAEREGAVA